MIGTTLSHYEITAELGRGGMGIVYKARDTKLDRDVAIKVLPSSALASSDDRERWLERETRQRRLFAMPCSLQPTGDVLPVDRRKQTCKPQ